MSVRNRINWAHHIDQIIRTQHYTRLAEGLAGEPPEEVVVEIVADLMHLCKRQGISWQALVEQSLALYEREEYALAP